MGEQSIGLRAALREVERLGVMSMDVPEWSENEEEPLKVYWKPVSTAKLMKYSGDKKSHALARIVVDNALDENGNRLFKANEYLELAKAGHYKTVSRIANKILGSDDDESEDEDEEFDPPLKGA